MKRNWLVISKLTWGIWRILTQELESLKNFHFNSLLLSKVYIAWTEKYRGVIFHETEEDTTFGEELTCRFKIDIRQILTWALESLNNFHFNRLLLSKVYIVWASTEELYFMKLKRDTKFGEESTCSFKIGIRNLTKFHPSTQKSQRFPL